MATTTGAASRPSRSGSARAPDMSGVKTRATTEVPGRRLPPESAGALAMAGPKTTLTLAPLAPLTLMRRSGRVLADGRAVADGRVLEDHLRRTSILPTPLLAPLHLLRDTRDIRARRGADRRGHRLLARRPTPRATAPAHPSTQVGMPAEVPSHHPRRSRQTGVFGRRWSHWQDFTAFLVLVPLSPRSHHRRAHRTGLGVPGLLGVGTRGGKSHSGRKASLVGLTTQVGGGHPVPLPK